MSVPAEIDGFDAGPLGRLALSRSAVDRATQRRSDAEWIEAAWADPRNRVVVVHASQALGRIRDGRPELVFVAVGLDADRIHAPNEYVDLSRLLRGAESVAYLWEELAAAAKASA